MFTSSIVIKLRIPKVYLRIGCSSCGGDLVRQEENTTRGKKLVCIPCGTDTFYAYHSEVEAIDRTKKAIERLKGKEFTPESFDQIINQLGADFGSIFQ